MIPSWIHVALEGIGAITITCTIGVMLLMAYTAASLARKRRQRSLAAETAIMNATPPIHLNCRCVVFEKREVRPSLATPSSIDELMPNVIEVPE